MNNTFELPVQYNGKELEFAAQLQEIGYTHKIQVDVYGIPVMFEPDEERNYRAYIDPSIQQSDKVNICLLQAIAIAIEEIVE